MTTKEKPIDVIIRSETANDGPPIHTLLTEAFPEPVEAPLVDRLRADGDLVYSLVAERAGRIVGYAGFSVMIAPFRALGLGPVAVAEGERRQGIAAALILEGLKMARADTWHAVFVLGSPSYYSRFGFSVDAAAGFESRYAGPYLMALGLREKGLPQSSGRVDYAPAFASVD